MDASPLWLRVIEAVFLLSSSVSILDRAFAAAPLLAFIYLAFIFAYAIGCFKLRPPDPIMFHSPLSIFNLFIFLTLQLSRFANAQKVITTTTTNAGTPTTFRPEFTVPSSADVGMCICWKILPVSDRFPRCETRSGRERTKLKHALGCLIAAGFALNKEC